ncbi:nucleotidyltransferase domain-containing protein [uncultured Roseibium sp.]|uniref:nucleotidyltransferase family protein n=1 Tax=uncultured Roseibium sp. TaxID=1936171 RepID=UPI0025934B23|nr:nucleotidyltransferase domain-containing protein [uncultured Roseibium sp.]
MPESETAFLSARVPARLKNRFKSLAAERGEKVQDLLNRLVQDYVEREDRSAPAATDVIRSLRAIQPDLEAKGLEHLFLFGSVARGEARPDSDIDLAYQVLDGKTLSLFDLGRIMQQLKAALGTTADIDLVPDKDLFSHVSETATRDRIEIF